MPRRNGVAWRTLRRWIEFLDERGEVLWVKRPIDVEFDAPCIADRLVKNNGPTVVFEKPRLPDGTISKIPLIMNMFGTRDRTLRALGVEDSKEIGNRLVNLMKPDIGTFIKRPWKAIPLAKDAFSLPPKKIRRGAAQRIKMENTDVTKLPIPKTWPRDGGQFITLPLVVTKDPMTDEHNLGMYRAQIFGPKKVGLHWQLHKHGAEHAAAFVNNSAKSSTSSLCPEGSMPVAICMGGPPELIFSAIAPLPDNLEEYMFAGFLGRKRLKICKALTQNLWIPSEADIVIEGYTTPGETMNEGPFGDHFGYYSLEGEFPIMHVTAISYRKDAFLPATIVGLPPMEDGYLGEAIGDAFLPVLNFQHRDVIDLFLPLETGFHNLAIIASKQRYPRQARKTALGLLGAGQMMFLKTIITTDPNHPVKDLDALLDVLDKNVNPATDLIVLEGMVADQLEHAAPWENIHDKLLIDASTPVINDPLFGQNLVTGPGNSLSEIAESEIAGVIQARMLRPSMMVVTTEIEGGPRPEESMETEDDVAAGIQRELIFKLINSIWQLESSTALRWLFITDAEFDLTASGARRRLLWQLFCRFDVGRDLYFDDGKERVAWDATAPIPCSRNNSRNLPVRRWPGVTLHDSMVEDKIDMIAKEEDWDWALR